MSGRPVIGITTYLTTARWSYWELPAALIPAAVVVVDEIPVDASGDPDFSALPQADLPTA